MHSARQRFSFRRGGRGGLLAVVAVIAVVAGSAVLLWRGQRSSTQARPPLTLNVRDFGAKGDGVADDTGALQAALDFRDKGHDNNVKVIRFPKGNYVAKNGLRVPTADRVTFDGEGTATVGYGPLPSSSSITFTGTGNTSFISAGSSRGFTLRNMGVYYTSSSFSGTLLDLSASTDSLIENCSMAGVLPVFSAHALVSYNNANGAVLRNCHLSFADRAIEGRRDTGSHSNRVAVSNTTFDNFSSGALMNAGDNWSLTANGFEGLTFGAQESTLSRAYWDDLPLQPSGQPAVTRNFKFNGGWLGDLGVDRNQPWIGSMRTVFDGAEFRGNFIDGQVGIVLAGGDHDVQITGNQFSCIRVSIDIGPHPSDNVLVVGNSNGNEVANANNGSTHLTIAGNATSQDVKTPDGGATLPAPPSVMPERPRVAPIAPTLGSPAPPWWSDVKRFGAKGDGVTDDADAVQAAIDSKAKISDVKDPAGGFVYFPAGTYLIKRPLQVHGTYSVTFQGEDANRARLLYTGEGSAPFIDARTTLGFTVRQLGIHYNNPAFTGYLIDYQFFDPSKMGTSAYMLIEHSVLTGDSPVHSAHGLVSWYEAIFGTIRDSYLGWAERGVDGKTLNLGYANAFSIERSTFEHLSVGAITNAGQGYAVVGNLFRGTDGGQGGATLTHAYYDELPGIEPTTIVGFLFDGNWMEDGSDVNDAWVRTEHSGFVGAEFTNNYFGGGASGIKLGTHSHQGIDVAQNIFNTTASAVDLNVSATNGVAIWGNTFSAGQAGFAAVKESPFGSTSRFTAGNAYASVRPNR